MIQALFLMGGLGVIIGIVLAFASKIFYVYVDPLVEKIEGALPGANCGGCGLPGCSANAEAIAKGKASPDSCVAGGDDLAGMIAAILGVSVEAKEPDFAFPGCTYNNEEAETKYIYNGLTDCRAASLISGGVKVCHIGCLGLGSCVKACKFGALSMGPDGLPKVDKTRCIGCGACEKACPKSIINLSSVTRRIIREYTTNNCTTPCQRACPAGIDIREYIQHISMGDYSKAVQVIKERNPFPTVIGRICPRPCEQDCRRQLVDEPVAINFLKRYAADYEYENGKRSQPFKAPETGRKIAVIGGGVEGLSTAFFSARLGHSPTIFEATDKLGGLLRSAIARNRLPLHVLDWDIEGVLDMGVTAQTNKSLGKDFTISSLLNQGYESVFTASGGWDNRLARSAGKVVESLVPGMFLMIDLNRNLINPNMLDMKSGAVIVGGGELVIDAIKNCKSLGASKITVFIRESGLDLTLLKTMKESGATVILNSGITRLLGKGDHLKEVEYMDLRSQKKEIVPTGAIFMAAGRFPELIFMKPEAEKDADSGNGSQTDDTWQAFENYKKPFTNGQEKGLLSQEDVITDFSAAIRAIGSGRRAAATIHQAIYKIELFVHENVIGSQTIVQNVDHLENVKPAPRQIMPLAEESDAVEIELGFTEDMARKEAERCLKCGVICYKKSDFPMAS
ncbi:MAG: RnfABCDGE type electron transport complex subunit B [Proteobacteria bacterium]|nr:RnfABCDGE type electron transport complex subunit B [Pseudomonadota bacterium]